MWLGLCLAVVVPATFGVWRVLMRREEAEPVRSSHPLPTGPTDPHSQGLDGADLCSGRMEIPGGGVAARCRVICQDGHQVAPVSRTEAKLSRGLKSRGA